MDNLDKKICRVIQNDIPTVMRPFQKLAVELNISEKVLLQRIKKLKQNGIIRKLSAFLKHQCVGYSSNILVVWKVPERRIREVSRICCSFSEVSHCYQRVTHARWPYNLYTMVHGFTRKECEGVIELIARKSKIKTYELLYSKKEYKKTSVTYF